MKPSVNLGKSRSFAVVTTLCSRLRASVIDHLVEEHSKRPEVDGIGFRAYFAVVFICTRWRVGKLPRAYAHFLTAEKPLSVVGGNS